MLTLLADFRRGRKFRVIKPGVRAYGRAAECGGFGTTGLRHFWESCVIPLSVGDVLTCNGPRVGPSPQPQRCCNGEMKTVSG